VVWLCCGTHLAELDALIVVAALGCLLVGGTTARRSGGGARPGGAGGRGWGREVRREGRGGVKSKGRYVWGFKRAEREEEGFKGSRGLREGGVCGGSGDGWCSREKISEKGDRPRRLPEVSAT
jgi:hypothetical protein